MKDTQRGFTLIEVMISLSLGLFLLDILTKTYVELKSTTHFLQSVDEVQTNAQMALFSLTRDVRMAGYIGCPRLEEINIQPANTLLKPNYILVGWKQGQSTSDLSCPIHHAIGDVLMVQYADPQSIALPKTHGGNIHSLPSHMLNSQDTFVISDCQKAEVFQGDQRKLKLSYGPEATLSQLHRILYYVAPTRRKNQKGDTVYALFRKDLNTSIQKPIEIVEGIEKMDILYGLLTPTNTLNYYTADTVPHWEQVVNMTLTLHLSSLESVTRKKLSLFSKKRTHPDTRLKRVEAQTIGLRARMR